MDAKLARLQADVGDFREEAEWIARSVPEAEQLLKELELVAAHRTHHADDEPVAAALDHRPERREDPPKTTNDPTETAREAVLALLREHPDRSWAPQLAYDELRRRGRGFARTAVQTALQRMAADGRFVKRVRPGAYQAVLDSAHSANGHFSERWLTAELLQQLAEDTGSRFVANHPGAADHDDLVAEAKRRVEVWIERHDGGEPDNEAHLRRLMKTALDDYYRRLRRNGSKPGTNVGVEEVGRLR